MPVRPLGLMDRYLLRSLLLSYAICASVILVLYVILDAFSNADNFIKFFNAPGHAAETFYPLKIIVRYYAYSLPPFFVQASAFLCLISAMFTITLMARNNELTPLKANGISGYRLSLPFFLFAGLLMLGSFSLQEWVIPKTAGKAEILRRTLQVKNSISHYVKNDANGNVIYVKEFRPRQGLLSETDITERYARPPHRLKALIHAREGVFIRRGIVCSDGLIFQYEDTPDNRLSPGFPVAFGPQGFTFRTRLKPEDFEQHDCLTEFRSSRQLLRMVRENPQMWRLQVIFHQRGALLMAHFLLLLLGLPLALSGERKSIYLDATFCLLISGAYFCVFLFFNELANKGMLNPLVGSWFPQAVFLSLGLTLYARIRT